MGPIIVDTALLLLLVVGSTDRTYIASHRRLREEFGVDEFDRLIDLLRLFSDIVATPNTLSEVSNLARQTADPARGKIQRTLRTFVESNIEIYVESTVAAQRDEFVALGLTDAGLLHLASISLGPDRSTLISVDQGLLNTAASLGYDVIDFQQWG